MKQPTWTIFVSFLAIGMPIVIYASNNPQVLEEELTSIFGDEEFISIATGREQPISKAPAAATVITAEDIKKIGATNLEEVLETVPGFHVARSAIGYDPIYTIRGIYSEFNPQVLMLINGFPATNIYLGNRGQAWSEYPVQNIARIEVIRGPGSAVYGADAYAGVINVITKTSDDIQGTEVGARVGSHDRYDAWLLHGDRWGKFASAFYLQVHTTNGHNRTVSSDFQSVLDAQFLSNASLAPGPVNTSRDQLEAGLDLAYDNWRFRGGYREARNVGSGAGVNQALDPGGDTERRGWNADLTYQNATFYPDWDLKAQFSYFDVGTKSNLVLLPPGADFRALAGLLPPPASDVVATAFFPNGVLGNPDKYERHYRLDLSGFYTGLEKHQIRLGTGFHYSDLYRVQEAKNYIFYNILDVPLPIPIPIPIPLPGGLTNVTDTPDSFISEEERKLFYAFAQDEWNLAPDWTLTAGLRYDHYSDFGDTFNPRLALVWKSAYNLTTKFLYGRAFRAPSFTELYNRNNPVVIGNSDLEPETIDTYEVAFDYQPRGDLRTGLNLFYYEMDNIIRFVHDSSASATATAQNTGRQTGYGLEWEIKWDLNEGLDVMANYAYQKSKDEVTNSDAGYAPHHQLYGRVDWQFVPDWQLNVQANWVADRKRPAGDVRPDIDDYVTVDATLRYRRKNGLEAAFSVRNLLDADAREPSLSPGLIADDLPLAGRTLYGELRYVW